MNNKTKQRVQNRKSYILEKKNVPCCDCGGKFPPCCMDFHHVEERDQLLKNRYGTGKVRNGKSILSEMKTWSIGRIDEELKKCVVLCANCHRIRHNN